MAGSGAACWAFLPGRLSDGATSRTCLSAALLSLWLMRGKIRHFGDI